MLTEINLSLDSYIRVFNSYIDKKICKDVVNELDSQRDQFKPHQFYSPITKKYQENPKDCLTYSNRISQFNDISMAITNAFNDYIVLLNMPWFNSINKISHPKWNRYDVGMTMENHCDHIGNLYDNNVNVSPQVSIIGCLNSNFEGGEVVFFNKQVIKLQEGDLVVFPSNFLYPHKINEISKGTRFSFVSWAYTV